MSYLYGPIGIAALIILALVLFKIFTKPLRLFLKLILHTVFGFIALFVINLIGGIFGITIGVNLLNAVIVGVFGLPGAALLLIIKWLTLL